MDNSIRSISVGERRRYFSELYRSRPAMISAGLEITRRNFVNEHAVSRFTRVPSLSLFRRLVSKCFVCVSPRTRHVNSVQSIVNVTNITFGLYGFFDESRVVKDVCPIKIQMLQIIRLGIEYFDAKIRINIFEQTRINRNFTTLKNL